MYEDSPLKDSASVPAGSKDEEQNVQGGLLAFRNDIVQETMEKAQRLYNLTIDNARERAADMEQKAYEKGYAKGLEEGRENGNAEGLTIGMKTAEINSQKLLNELKTMIEAVERDKDSIIEKFANDIVSLSVRIAEKIVRHDIDTSASAIANIIKACINDYKNTEWMKIYVSDYETADYIKADWELEDVLREVSDNVRIEVLKDGQKGSCVIEMPDEIIDAGINNQLENMKNVFGLGSEN